MINKKFIKIPYTYLIYLFYYVPPNLLFFPQKKKQIETS